MNSVTNSIAPMKHTQIFSALVFFVVHTKTGQKKDAHERMHKVTLSSVLPFEGGR